MSSFFYATAFFNINMFIIKYDYLFWVILINIECPQNILLWFTLMI